MNPIDARRARRYRAGLALRLVLATVGIAIGIATSLYSFVGLPRLGDTTFVDLFVYCLRLFGGLMLAGFVLGWLFEWIRANEPKP